MTAKNTGPGPRKDHRPRMVQPKHHDTYASNSKSAGVRVCDGCSAYMHAGKWSWGDPPEGKSSKGLCPACERVRDRYPAGTIRLHGDLATHGEEIRNMIAKVEAIEKKEHPLERVMDISAEDDGLLVTTTGLHIARRITSKLERRFHHVAKIHYPAEQHMISVEMEI